MESLWLVGAIILAVIVMLIQSRRKRWYKVYMANNDVRLLYKTTTDWWFREGGGKLVFRDNDGRVWVFPSRGHWILMYMEVRDIVNEAKAVKGL